ncbi:hypothetical protein KO516_01835 [Citreicella sp. C3M06]|uniref:hypothetical protein n=1 Tax=Roseobacteraceae TaxID=2854170 RepID=UPI001C09AFA1|nr:MULTISPECIES: hypothetical protein [Roseobacteraceae]MBU2959583.1 hypothetical protein [Citreicella sp. C3M06]MDO6586252.1 hypothetical protein [Salipiger sp. 1_MG-2023]
MDAIKISEYATALYNAHGAQAEVEAARRARECEAAGKTAEQEDWSAIQAAIRAKRGALQS